MSASPSSCRTRGRGPLRSRAWTTCAAASASPRSFPPTGPPSLTVSLSPSPTFVIVWRGEPPLSVSQRRGGAMPAHPPTGQPLAGVADSTWWRDGSVHRLGLKRDEFWIEGETDLPFRALKRTADTLPPY